MPIVQNSEIKATSESLATNGYAVNPFCPACHGNGYVHPRGANGVPQYDKVVPCRAPGCISESYEKARTGPGGLLSHGLTTWAHRLDSFVVKTGTDKAVAAFRRLVDDDSPPPFLFCYGVTGNGKSHLCEAVTIGLLQRGIDTWYYTVAGFMGMLKDQIDKNLLEQTIKTCQELPGLVLDDWGELTDWEEEQLKNIINERYRWHRITVMTSNRSLERLCERNERIMSRFRDAELAVIVLNEAEDYRPFRKG